jgi:16S rRNA (cytosine1402-N4)-methyltransferase
MGDAMTTSRVLEKGGTPAGSHVPIMPYECMERLGLLQPPPQSPSLDVDYGGNDMTRVIVDCTLGYGGHARLILDELSRWSSGGVGCDEGRSAVLVALDRDSVELVKTEERLMSSSIWNDDDGFGGGGGRERGRGVRLECVHSSFAHVHDALRNLDLPPAYALLADLGCSSMQVDDPTRGFTYKSNGPLDMRMDASNVDSMSAYDVLTTSNVTSLSNILRTNSDFDRDDARRIAMSMLRAPLPKTTSELDARVRDVMVPTETAPTTSGTSTRASSTGERGGRRSDERGMKGGGRLSMSGGTATTAADRDMLKKRGKEVLNSRVARVMQALRIEVNREYDALDTLLDSLPRVLAPGGRAVFLTFHSGEDRRVKAAMKDGMRDGMYTEVSRRVIRPSPEEMRANPRSKCCKLRWCVRSSMSAFVR